MTHAMPDPFRITQEVLDRSSAALVRADEAAFLAYIALPFTAILPPDTNVISDPAHLRAVYRALSNYFSAESISDLDRHCVAATFVRDEEIIATYESRYIVKTRLLAQRTVAIIRLRRDGGDWRIFEGHFTFRDTPTRLINALLLPPPSG